MISKNYIPNKLEGEQIIIHVRRHWLIFLKIFFFFLSLFLIPPALLLMVNNIFPKLITNEVGYSFILVSTLSYYLFMLVFVFTTWTETYLDVWTVTTYRIINREQNGLFNRSVSQLDLSKIQDITAEQKGFFATLFHYGNVYVQSAGEKERFIFEQIPQPYRIAKIIQHLNENLKTGQNSNQKL